MIYKSLGNTIDESSKPELLMIRIVVLDPKPALPPASNGEVTVAIGPPLGQAVQNVVVVVDSREARS